MIRVAVVVVLILFAVPVLAETFTWTDDKGTVNFTEDYGRIPKKYRKKARKIGEEPEPPPVADTKETPAAARPAVPAEVKEQAPAPASVKVEKKKELYGGKDAEAWKNEFGPLRADLKASEDQLVTMRSRLEDTSRMSRSEYLNLTYSIRNVEKRVVELRKKVQDLETEATKAGVPADYR